MGHAKRKTCLRAYADSEGPDQPAHPLAESLDTTECMRSVWRAKARMILHAQDALNMCILRMFDEFFFFFFFFFFA